MPNAIIVTGCDAAHFELASDLMASLSDAGREGLAIGFVHVGDGVVPPEIVAVADRVVHVPDDAFLTQGLTGFRLAFLMIKARLPDLFSGYDTYVWLDGDTWVQDRLGLDQIVHSAQLADVCAHPELDPNYHRERIPADRTFALYPALFGQAGALSDMRLPMFNSGVFGARAGSPLWAAWREVLTEVAVKVRATSGLYFSDQIALHRLIARGRVSVHPLRAANNWLVHAARPAIDLTRKRLVAPTYPHEDINIIHMTWVTKDATFRLGDGGREISFRYRSIKALFSESA